MLQVRESNIRYKGGAPCSLDLADKGFIKLNVDDSFRGNPGPASFEGLFRDCHGEWMWGFEGFVGVIGNLEVKLLAIRCGLKLAWQWGFPEDCLLE